MGGDGGCSWVGEWEEVIIKLISAKAEAEALLGLAELGKNTQICLATLYRRVSMGPRVYKLLSCQSV